MEGLTADRASEALEFITRRLAAERRHTDPRCYGRSSDALALYGVGSGPRPLIPGRETTRGFWQGDECGTDYPLDESDLRACELTYEMAPSWAQDRMLPVLEEFRRWVRGGINRHGEPTLLYADRHARRTASGHAD